MKLYENIKNRRLALGLTQKELADRLGYKSTSTIAKIESGTNDIPQSKIVAFAKALGVTPGYLLGDVKEEISAPSPMLSSSEEELLSKFRRLDQENQEDVMDYIDMRLAKYEKSAKKDAENFG